MDVFYDCFYLFGLGFIEFSTCLSNVIPVVAKLEVVSFFLGWGIDSYGIGLLDFVTVFSRV